MPTNDALGMSTLQMQQLATLMSTALGMALAKVIPAPTQNAPCSAAELPPNFVDKGDNDETLESNQEPDEIDLYDRSLDDFLRNSEAVGPEIFEKVG